MLQVSLTQHIVLGVMNYLAAVGSLFLSLPKFATQDLHGQYLLPLKVVQTVCSWNTWVHRVPLGGTGKGAADFSLGAWIPQVFLSCPM